VELLGFTGARHIEPARGRLREYLGAGDFRAFASRFDGYVTGACVGWDALVGEHLVSSYPEKRHVVIVPADRSRADDWWCRAAAGAVAAIEMPAGTDYRARNAEIVRRSARLFYCAEYPEGHPKSRRSGTWMTVRLARKAGLEVTGIVLNEP
jgi:hypothetical protein